ncbi:hypothetical protein V6Z12_D06G212000 [Gossypium hirsutum]
MMIRSKVIVIFVSNIEIQAFGRLRASLNSLVVESFAKKKFSSVKSLHATILSTTNTIALRSLSLSLKLCDVIY